MMTTSPIPDDVLSKAARAMESVKPLRTSTEEQLAVALSTLVPAIQQPLLEQIARLQAAIRWYDDGENTDAAIEIVCWETLRQGDMKDTDQ